MRAQDNILKKHQAEGLHKALLNRYRTLMRVKGQRA
jgi:hypothetical protein